MSHTRRGSLTSLNDTGFAAALAGFTTSHALSLGGREYFGALVEQLAAVELEKQCGWSGESYRVYHYRDTDGLEVDLVLELADGRLIAIEVKAASDVNAKAWRGLKRFRERFADRDVTVCACIQAHAPGGSTAGCTCSRSQPSGSTDSPRLPRTRPRQPRGRHVEERDAADGGPRAQAGRGQHR